MGNHPVALGNAIDALTRRWADTSEVYGVPDDAGVHARVQRRGPACAARTPQAIRGNDVDIQSRNGAGPERSMNSAGTVRAFQRKIVAMAQQKLGRPLTAKEHAFITSRGGFIALEAILDTVEAATASELKEYLNSE
jgi:hypothetical protein